MPNFLSITLLCIAAAVFAETNTEGTSPGGGTGAATNGATNDFFDEMIYEERPGFESVKELSASVNEDIIIQIATTNFNTYVRINGFDTNALTFLQVTRDDTRSQLMFKAVREGIASVSVDLIEDLSVTARTTYRITVKKALESKTNAAAVGKKDKDTEERKQYQIAMDLFKAKAYTEARALFSTIAQKYPSSEYGAKSAIALGDIAYAQNNYQEAIGAYTRVGTITGIPASERDRSQLALGLCYRALKDNQKALSAFLTLERMSPDGQYAGNALYYAALVLNDTKNRAQAIETLKRALAKHKSYELRPESVYLLASIYDKGGSDVRNLTEAYKQYGEYASKYPAGVHITEAIARRAYLEKHFINLR
ncbi:MAG: tetratricopeptide repeat protein [Spirochaetota bacterium]